jgi:hypothetical protein
MTIELLAKDIQKLSISCKSETEPCPLCRVETKVEKINELLDGSHTMCCDWCAYLWWWNYYAFEERIRRSKVNLNL